MPASSLTEGILTGLNDAFLIDSATKETILPIGPEQRETSSALTSAARTSDDGRRNGLGSG